MKHALRPLCPTVVLSGAEAVVPGLKNQCAAGIRSGTIGVRRYRLITYSHLFEFGLPTPRFHVGLVIIIPVLP